MSKRICNLSDLADGIARGYALSIAGQKISVILIHHAGQVYAYQNSCPHTGVSLDWMPDEFMDVSGKLLQCATHGALFQPENGYCIHGPCVGSYLKKVAIQIKNSNIYLE
jgi:nitrite reductase/ring-hydroxylating ferredoxin subunit